MNRRLVVITEIIAPYRIPVFNALARQQGIDLHVIFLAENDPGLRQWHVYRNELRFSYQIIRSWRRRLGKVSLLLNWGLTSALHEARPAAIICGGYGYVACWRAKAWAKRNRIPFLVWVESNANDQRSGGVLIESLKTRFLRDCDGAVVPGTRSAEYVGGFGIAEELIFTAPNAVDNELFARGSGSVRAEVDVKRATLGLPSRYFLYVGRLIREKGVFDLLEAYRNLAPELQETTSLVLSGDGPARKELEEIARRITPGKIFFPGFVQRDQLATLYGPAEVFVFPTHSDPWGLVANEAMACGLPVIITNVAGCTEDLVQDGWNGRVVAARSPADLATAMTQIASDPELRNLMGQRSLERIASHSPENCAAGMARAAHAFWSSHAD